MVTLNPKPLGRRFIDKFDIDTESGCWNWTAGKHRGYGTYVVNGRNVRAHRHAYEVLVGPIPSDPPDLTIDHLCRNRGCVNPAHMEIVTRAVNVMRGDGAAARNKRKTRCPKGHYYTQTPRQRICRVCKRLRERMPDADRRSSRGAPPATGETPGHHETPTIVSPLFSTRARSSAG